MRRKRHRKNNSLRNLFFVLIVFIILLGLLIGGIVFFVSNYFSNDNNTNNNTSFLSEEKHDGGIGFFDNLFGGEDEEEVFKDKNIYISNIEEGQTFSKGETIKLQLKAKDIFKDGNTYVFVGIYDIKNETYAYDKTIDNVKGELSDEIVVETGNLKPGQYYIDAIISDINKDDFDLVDNGCVFTTTINIK